MAQFRVTWRHEVVIEAENESEAREKWENLNLGDVVTEQSYGNIVAQDFVEEISFDEE